VATTAAARGARRLLAALVQRHQYLDWQNARAKRVLGLTYLQVRVRVRVRVRARVRVLRVRVRVRVRVGLTCQQAGPVGCAVYSTEGASLQEGVIN